MKSNIPCIRACALLAILSMGGCADDVATPVQAPRAATDGGGGADGAPGSGSGAAPGADAGGVAAGDAGAPPVGGDGGGDAGGGGASKYNVDLTQSSVSGISSGGYMAVQFHVANSAIMKGVGVFAGGPFYCAQTQLTNAFTQCMYSQSAPNVTPLVQTTRQWGTSGLIDDPAHLAGQRIFLFGGADDQTVYPPVMDALKTYYAAFVAESAIAYESRHPGTSHTMPTRDFGTSCDVSADPWLGKCNYDGAGQALGQIYGTLVPPAAAAGGAFVTVSQGTYLPNPASHSVADTGYLYVPASCARGEPCRVHVVFHGCKQNASGSVGDAFYKHAGYNEWADTNHLLVLYPQTIASTAPNNPNACWDWWAYDSPNYANKTGPQMAMVRAMLERLAAGSAL